MNILIQEPHRHLGELLTAVERCIYFRNYSDKLEITASCPDFTQDVEVILRASPGR